MFTIYYKDRLVGEFKRKKDAIEYIMTHSDCAFWREYDIHNSNGRIYSYSMSKFKFM